jgi:uncharacterized protein
MKDIAVIGSGISGLAAAWLCRQKGWRVELFERHSEIGMLAHGLEVHGGTVDVPLRVVNERDWSNLLGLANEVGVETFAVRVETTCNWMDGRTWFRSGVMPVTGWPIPGSWRYLGADAARMGLGLLRLAGVARELGDREDAPTLGELLDESPFDDRFWRGLMLPILQTICTCDEEHLLDWPARPLLDMLRGVLHSGDLLRLKGGTRALAEGLTRGLTIHTGSIVTEINQDPDGIRLKTSSGAGGTYDRVIVATQANQMDFLAGSAWEKERRILTGVPYADGHLWVHEDLRFLPHEQRDWGALNFLMDEDLQQSMFTVRVNAVEPTLNDAPSVLQTWNPLFEPDPEHVHACIPMQRAVVNVKVERIRSQLRRWHAQPKRRLFYCGSWAGEGVPLLDSAVRSARSVVEIISDQP